MLKITVGTAYACQLACSLAIGRSCGSSSPPSISRYPIAATIGTTAMETCKAQGYNVSVHVIGDMGLKCWVALRADNYRPAIPWENSNCRQGL